MPDRLLTGLWALAAAALIVVALAAAAWGLRPAASVAAGGAWNLASLWCLSRMLHAWLGPHPSRRRVVGWLLVKFPLLYSLVWLVLRVPAFSWVGFGVGFSVVLLVAVGWFTAHAQRLAIVRAHVR